LGRPRKKRRASPRDKTILAWGAYLDLTEAARWMDRKLTAALDVFGLTHEEFRLLVVLYKNGPMTRRDATEKLGRIKRAVHETVRTAEEFGWVSVAESYLPAVEMKESRLSKSQRGKPRVGLKVGMVSLTPEGERLVGRVLPRQETAVKRLMDELHSRELESLSRICRRLRGSEALPFWSEVVRQSSEHGESGEAEESE
jgi:DNA-binding MarR family transcriptional regulator